MKCNDARIFLSEISDKSITTQIPQEDLDFLSTSSYVTRTSKVDHDLVEAEVANLEQMNQRLQQERAQGGQAQKAASQDEKKVHSLFFGLHGEAYKDETRQKLETDQEALSKDQAVISDDEASISNYIQKKSALDQLVPYSDEYLSLSSSGVLMLNALNARMSRISDMEFSDFVQETKATDAELQGIAQRANYYFTNIRSRISFPSLDERMNAGKSDDKIDSN